MFNIDIFEEVLNRQIRAGKLSKKTATYYIARLKTLNEKCGNDNVKPAAIEAAINELCKANNQGLKYIAAIKKYESEVLGSQRIILFGESLSRLQVKYKADNSGKEISLEEGTYLKKINRLGNERLKLAYRLEHKSGLRISEIAALDKKRDILFGDDKSITVIVRNGKGGKSRTVNVMEDEYLYDRLKAHIERLGEGEAPFYSESYLKKKAGEYGIQTHDLRRVNARQRFRGEIVEGSTMRGAKRAVGRELGHESVKVTSMYLGRGDTV